MKYTKILVAMVLAILISGYSYAARDVSIDLRFVKQNVNVGDEFPVDIIIDRVTDLKGINLIISFDNLKLEYESASKGAIIKDFTEDIIPDKESAKTSGKLEYMATLESSGPGIESSGGILLTIIFFVKAPGNTWVKLLTNETALADSTANSIPSVIDQESRAININQIFELRRVFNYPNPAPNPSGYTTIRCESLAILDGLEAKILDISGELVKEIAYEDFDNSKAPIYEYEWDCKNEKEQEVANGTYLLWINAKLGSDEKNKTWKIAILR